MSQTSQCIQPTMYKFFYFKIEIKTKVDLYMSCKAMGHSTKFYFLVCQHLYVQMIPSHICFDFWSAINHLYVWTIASHILMLISGCSHAQMIASHILILISCVQSFTHVNDCKSCHILFLGVSWFTCANNYLLKGLMHHTKTL